MQGKNIFNSIYFVKGLCYNALSTYEYRKNGKKFMSSLSEQIKKNNASAFTHSGKFHADDVFSAALLLYLNPEINISRGNKVPEDFDGIVFDIGYDHRQNDFL